MQTIEVCKGTVYAITSPAGCTVTNAEGNVLATVDAGVQKAVVATDAQLNVSDDTATITQVFGTSSSGIGDGGGSSSYVLTAEDVKAVVPINWDTYSVRYGYTSNAASSGTALGARTNALGNSVAVGLRAKAQNFSSAIGSDTFATKSTTITLGAGAYTETVDGTKVTHTCKTEGTGSITIGAGANTLNTTASDGTVTESSNAVTIGCKALNQGVDSVVIGAQAGGRATGGITIGAGAKSSDYSTVIGRNAQANYMGVVVGNAAKAVGYHGIALGAESSAYGGNSVALGKYSASNGASAVAIGTAAKADPTNTIAIGNGATITNTTNADNTVTLSVNTTVIGYGTTASAPNAIALGAQFDEVVDEVTTTYPCTTEGTGSITIGAGAVTKNTTTTGSDGTETTVESSNAITIGHKASNSAADSVVIGAGASTTKVNSIVIGVGATGTGGGSIAFGNGSSCGGSYSVVIGTQAQSQDNYNVVIGRNAQSGDGTYAVALGYAAQAKKVYSTALGAAAAATVSRAVAVGYGARAANYGVVVHRSTAEDGTVTQLYFSGANTPLATTYEGGAPMLGYTVTDSAGNVTAAGTRSLLELLTNNSTFAPATTDENGELVMPKVFHPSDLDLPQEEPAEPETEYTPIPVHPTVEPEVDIPEPTEEEYTPLPVYPIVEPEIEE